MYTINLVENFLSFTLWSVDFRISSAKGKVIGDRDTGAEEFRGWNKGCEFFLGIDKRPCNICELCFHG